MERKLAAILSADVQGYSRLMGDDEEATIQTLTAYREVMTTFIQQHRGRVTTLDVKTIEDIGQPALVASRAPHKT